MTAAAVLSRPVLTLNRHWRAVKTTSVLNAIALVMRGRAVIVDPETYEEHTLYSWESASHAKARFRDAVIRTPRLILVAPEIIRLTAYEGRGEGTVVFSRRNLFKRDRYTCQYCGDQPGPESLTIDHVLPKSRGGKSEWSNCVLACLGCNAKKADRTPDEAGMHMRRAPKKPAWSVLVNIPRGDRRLSWEQFLSKAYWEIELEP
jgi:5-methylcytosine-specific restriction endonuclease McrA